MTCERFRTSFARFGLASAVACSGLMLAGNSGVAAPAWHEAPRHYCARVGNDDTLRKPPRSLAADIHRLFNIGGEYALQTTHWRCAGGDVLVCAVGANLPCGEANTATVMPAATQWCRTHQNSDFIPMAVIGHDTVYSWRCAGRTAEPSAQTGKVDGRGFFAENWKKL